MIIIVLCMQYVCMSIKCVYLLINVHCQWQCFSWGFFVQDVVLQSLMSLADVKIMWWCKQSMLYCMTVFVGSETC